MKTEQDGITITISGSRIDQVEQVEVYFRGWRESLNRSTTITTYDRKGETTNVEDHD